MVQAHERLVFLARLIPYGEEGSSLGTKAQTSGSKSLDLRHARRVSADLKTHPGFNNRRLGVG